MPRRPLLGSRLTLLVQTSRQEHSSTRIQNLNLCTRLIIIRRMIWKLLLPLVAMAIRWQLILAPIFLLRQCHTDIATVPFHRVWTTHLSTTSSRQFLATQRAAPWLHLQSYLTTPLSAVQHSLFSISTTTTTTTCRLCCHVLVTPTLPPCHMRTNLHHGRASKPSLPRCSPAPALTAVDCRLQRHRLRVPIQPRQARARRRDFIAPELPRRGLPTVGDSRRRLSQRYAQETALSARNTNPNEPCQSAASLRSPSLRKLQLPGGPLSRATLGRRRRLLVLPQLGALRGQAGSYAGGARGRLRLLLPVHVRLLYYIATELFVLYLRLYSWLSAVEEQAMTTNNGWTCSGHE